jgi:hypothetical protein
MRVSNEKMRAVIAMRRFQRGTLGVFEVDMRGFLGCVGCEG